MTMKKIILLLAFTLCTVPAFAQAVKLSNTTLNGAVTATANTVRLTSASASSQSNVGAPAVGQVLWTADNEAMQITATNVGGVSTVFGVIRGQFGTKPAAHATSIIVLTGPPSAFQAVNAPAGVQPGGACTASSVGAAPWVNLTNGNVGNCRSSLWKMTNFTTLTYDSVLVYP